MIDAYTIGITIALEDGVSAGVATIKQDLLALDRAIQATTAGLLALRRLGRQATVVGHIELSSRRESCTGGLATR